MPEKLRPCTQGHDKFDNLELRNHLKNRYLAMCKETGACPVCGMLAALFAAGIAAYKGLQMSEEAFLHECHEAYKSVVLQANAPSRLIPGGAE